MCILYNTSNRCANSSILASICACSERDTADGKEWKLVSQGRLRCLAIARLKVLHQIGMVLDKESGIRFPRRVESTMIQLYDTHKINKIKEAQSHDLPAMLSNDVHKMQVASTHIEIPLSHMTICWLEIYWMHLVLSYYIRPSVFVYTCKMIPYLGWVNIPWSTSFICYARDKQIVSTCISLALLQGYLPTKGSDGKRAAISFTKAASSSIDRRRLRLSKPISLSISLSLSLSPFPVSLTYSYGPCESGLHRHGTHSQTVYAS